MCGIAGIIGGNTGDTAALDARARAMIATLRHRGPDDEGAFTWSGGALAHARLSIIDIAGGAQPMHDSTGRWSIVFNGEIYNYLSINTDLAAAGREMKTRSDTETLANALAVWDAAALDRLRGMFAFCAADTETGRAILAVDRTGKKPLYYTTAGGALIFASEIKALLAHPDVSREIDPQAVDFFFTYLYIPAPRTIFKNIFKLPPAHLMIREPGGELKISRWWSVLDERPRPDGDWVRDSIEEAVRLRLISDVPLGAFLSGGLDSTAVVAAMSCNGNKVKTFCIGFDEPGYDESPHARAAAKAYGTEHREFRVKPDAGAALPTLAWHYDEPYADSSALPTYLLCKAARQEVTVALSGDGGDEAFVGYERYRANEFFKKLSLLPAPARKAAAAAALKLLPAHPDTVFWRRARKLLSAMKSDPRSTYIELMAAAPDTLRASLYSPAFARSVKMETTRALLDDALSLSPRGGDDALIAGDFHTYLPGDLLVKTDRASMAVSLEVRCPFLDHKLLENCYALSAAEKAPGGRLKALLKDYLRSEPLPAGFLERRKMGFGLPISVWFTGSLAAPARDLLLSDKAAARGYFSPEAVRGVLDAHASGRQDHGPLIWAMVVFELWHRLYVDTLTLTPPGVTLKDML